MSDHRNTHFQPRLVLVRDLRVGMLHPVLGRIVAMSMPYTDADEVGYTDVTTEKSDGERKDMQWQTFKSVVVLVPEIFDEEAE